MFRVATLLNNTVVNIDTYIDSPNLPSIFDKVDITNYSGEVKVGYIYNEITKTFSKPPIFEQEPGPEPEPIETLEQKLSRLEEKIEQFNLINTDISLTVYEEILALREEIASLKGTSGNA